MCLKYLFLLGTTLALALAGCASPDIQAVWPEPRPLGKDMLAYQPRPQLSAATLPARELTEPTGVLALREALALALLQNPELAASGWEVRAGEARTLQAGLPPNPELSLAVEDFAGSGELRGFSGTEITLQLSQVIELAGKRLKRARVAALERDLAAWEYEAKRLDVLTQVSQAFVEVLSAQEQLVLQQELVRLAEQVLATAAERVKAGKVSPVEETRARVELSTSRIALERAQRDLEAARKRLVATWGSTTPTFEKAEGSFELVTALPSAEQLAQRITQNPDIARWVTEMAQRQATVELEGARRIPDPTVGGGFRHFRTTGDHALLMEFSIPLPIFDRNQGGFLDARHRRAKAAEERRAAAVQAYAALGEAYAQLAAAYAGSHDPEKRRVTRRPGRL